MRTSLLLLAAALPLFPACGANELNMGSSTDAEVDEALRRSLAVCTTLTIERGSIGDGQTAEALAWADQSGQDSDRHRSVTFRPLTSATCLMTFPGNAPTPTALTLRVSYRGPAVGAMRWSFQAWDGVARAWVDIADNGFAVADTWSRAAIGLPAPIDRFISDRTVLLRYRTDSSLSSSALDQWALALSRSVLDAGAEAHDAGQVGDDAGVLADAGQSYPDAGVPRDAGTGLDAGSTADAGPWDAGALADAGTDAGSTGRTLVVTNSGGQYTTIQAALNAAVPGDTVLVRTGTYSENLTFPRSGAAGALIALQGENGATLDGTGKGELGISITGRSYVKVTGLTIRNFRSSGTPMGISVNGASTHVELRDNVIEFIENTNGNAHGIGVYGNAATPISDLVISGNEVRHCKLGQSESVVVNGNVDGFVVSHNKVHDNDNIGIDFIGFEGTGPAGQDQARNGVCTDNEVFNISSANNPTYHGERSADGIYVDGARDIVIERNRVDATDVGIEVASEHGGKTTSNIIVRNNFVARSFQGTVMVGGYAANKGNAQNIQVLHNTLYQGADGAVVLQFNCSGVSIRNNIFIGSTYVVASGSNNSGVIADGNLYFGGSTSSAGDFADSHAIFVDPQLKAPPLDLHLGATSPAINRAQPLGNDAQGLPWAGAFDLDGEPRAHGQLDVGADEVP